MIGGFGPWELAIVGLIVVLLFGAKKLPALGGAVGESIKNFKKGIHDGDKKLKEAEESEEKTEKKEAN